MSITFPDYTVAGQKAGASKRTKSVRRPFGSALLRLLIAPNSALIDDITAATIEEAKTAPARTDRPRARPEYLADIW